VQYQAVIQMAQMAPDIYDLPQLHRNMLEVLGIKNAEKLIPLDDDMKPTDPVSENQEILKCAPVKAFMFQDHQSHIAVHMAMIQDPTIQQLIGQNPKAAQMQAALMAHVAEHAGFQYRHQIEAQLGMALPPADEKLPPQIELALSSMMAQAAQQVLQNGQAQAAQQQAQQQAQDPIVQMQQQELQIKQGELALKQQKIQGDLALADKRLQVEASEKADRLHLDEKKLAVDAAAKADQLRHQEMGNNPELETLRAQYEMQANAQRHQQEMAAAQAQRQMEAQQHMQNLSHKEQVHAQNLKHQRAQAKVQQELAKKPESNSQEKTDK